ncbi:hypothetical protein [Reyranella sp.]|jgi:hypothetical protein|uniref:ATP-dependent Clp protease proteolytic subunit n=1 Tax=Reyranella sp. TaxID=1929291 RepID=UPI000BC412A9|nr:hypothetical protein [Reyranella sp.]OYY37161.1 MAG: hypothetical protein B7Y57_23190 [Rhodospirillales bacterium 35-66-84]OYZ94132.1 MAG: hypothetical protein B7Y08_13425 [Rhodospirillales bacterium 24-66-33]OZB22973.1 MAG: hypothetical protein B7X63_20575 [Rhodospirillales bacterium 39-66-50]HQS17147.1 hypothetical protein [Reyranella sp.]HQT13782.1 hypothetical protein [Reyranella sp.]
MRGSDLLLAAWLTVSLLVVAVVPRAEAMTFSTVTRADGLRIVLAEGSVADGDAERLRVALRSADRDHAGFKVMALDSPGGAIVEAFAMVDVMDREKVATVVRPGAACASACAQVLFLSGGHRTIEGNGRLGLHACHTAGDRTRSVACNELIARNAVARGTPYGSIMVFLHLTGPTQMTWMGSEEAHYLGFTRKAPETDPSRGSQVRASL